MENKIFVSIISPTLNEGNYIGILLNSLEKQSYPRELYEVIVVDNGSTDNTKRIAKAKSDYFIEAPQKSVAELRNIGASTAKGQLIGFIDADCKADDNWIVNAVEYYRKGKEVFGYKVEVPSDSGWIEKAWFSQRYQNEKMVNYINSANIFISANAFRNVNGFNPILKSGEDTDICFRLGEYGYNIWSNPEIKVTHLKNPNSIIKFLKREIWHGIGDFYLFKRGKINKTFCITLLFVLGVMTLFVGLIFNFKLFILGMVITLSVAMLSSLNNVLRYKNHEYFIENIILYYLYFLGRSLSLVKNILKRLRVKKCFFIV